MSESAHTAREDPGASPENTEDRTQQRRIVWSGALFGCGIVASMVDLLIFHQLLRWHHFYNKSTPDVSLISDGFFHAFGWFMTIWGLFMLADVRRRTRVNWTRWVGGVLLGGGVFQTFDGIVDHKILRIHEIRYDVNIVPYDVTWMVVAVALMVVGALMIRRTGATRRAD